MAHEKILLGTHSYTVRPQRIGYLIHKLGPNLQEALAAEVDGLDGASLVGVKAHDVLKVFIPDLMPAWEFIGFASQEAMDAGAYDEDADNSPEPLQIKAAFKAASDVNGGEVFSHLKALMGPVLWSRVTAFVAAKVAESGPLSLTPESSPTLRPISGGSDPTSSGTSAPTPTPPVSAA